MFSTESEKGCANDNGMEALPWCYRRLSTDVSLHMQDTSLCIHGKMFKPSAQNRECLCTASSVFQAFVGCFTSWKKHLHLVSLLSAEVRKDERCPVSSGVSAHSQSLSPPPPPPLQGSAKRWSLGCVNAAGKARSEVGSNSSNKINQT